MEIRDLPTASYIGVDRDDLYMVMQATKGGGGEDRNTDLVLPGEDQYTKN